MEYYLSTNFPCVRKRQMRPIGNALGIGLIMLGALWLLQEYSVLQGQFLPDLLPFPHRGAVAAGAGIIILALLYINPEKGV
jgi:TRAP-type C4-dicarboxylate transport system permease small subunit